MDNLFIGPGCSSERLTITETKKSKKLQARLAEDVRLMELARTTQTLYGKNEWQKRGNIHAHGLSKIKNDPGLTKLGLQVQEGRTAQMAQQINDDNTEESKITSATSRR